MYNTHGASSYFFFFFTLPLSLLFSDTVSTSKQWRITTTTI